MFTWSIEKKILELKYTWKISRNASDTKTNLFVSVTDGIHTGTGEVAPNIRYGETPESVQQQFNDFLLSQPTEIQSVEKLNECLKKFSVCNSLRFGIESAFVHYLAKKKNSSVSELLNVATVKSVPTSFSIPIMEIGKIKSFYEENGLSRFVQIKIKTNEEETLEAVKHLNSFCKQPIIVDANEAFHNVEKCIMMMEKMKPFKIEFIEQPMPSEMVEESLYLKKHSPFPLFADESVTDEADFSLLRKMFDGVNIKLMKAGGYFNAVKLLKDARKHNLKTMLGCMVETTLAISSAINLCSLVDYADLDSFLLLKDEPFALIKEHEGAISAP